MDKDEKQKLYDSLVKRLINSNLDTLNLDYIKNSINFNDFKNYFLKNCKKSSKNGQILPAFLFLLISLVSFSVVISNSKFVKFWGELSDENLQTTILLFGVVMMFFSIALFIQKYILNVKTVFVYTGYGRGYRNINNKKFNQIINVLDNLIEKQKGVII